MKRLYHIISALICVACSTDIFFEENIDMSGVSGYSSQINPAGYVSSTQLPYAATKAMIDVSTVSSMEANVLRIDENRETDDSGTYIYGSWEDAYLVESTMASPTSDGLRSMTLNPIQAYSYKVVDNDTTFYHTRMISWYPRTFNLHKNDEGKASVMKLSDYKAVTHDDLAYSKEDGKVILNFRDLDGSKDVMVSNIVEGQHWHTDDGSHYTYPFGQNDAKPMYSNIMTYKHYLSAVKIYAYAENSEQVVSMWGALRRVLVKNQPSMISVNLLSPGEMKDATISDRVQNNSSESFDYGSAVFSGKTDFPLLKTPMYASETNDPTDQEVAEDSPFLVQGQPIYLGYALIKPYVEDGQTLDLDVYTDAGVLSLEIPMKQTIKDPDTQQDVEKEYFQAGYIYTVEVNFNTEGAIATIVTQSGDEHYFDLSASKELSETVRDYQYANCYIISPEIKRYLNEQKTDYTYYDGYVFSATTVGSVSAYLYPEFYSDRTTKTIEPVRAGLLWESSPGLITNVEYLYGYIRFKVQPPKVKDGANWVDNGNYKEGNAVIAAYDSQRKVIWSWHIWVTDQPKDVNYSIGSKTITLLDRNLGATAAGVPDNTSELLETYGLYYQWGRKDPSMGPHEAYYRPQSTETAEYYDYYGMTWNHAGVVTMDRPGIRDGVENPMYLVLPTDFSMTTYQYDWMYTNVDNLWGDYSEKTIYDPCPFDYMIPQDEISTLFATATVTRKDKMGYVINDSFFPFAGYKGVDTGVSSLSVAWRYVGEKGDYMSAKIEDNGHRSRTYISNVSNWVEYGADADNDGDGDASRTYYSNILADDMTNRRTAASVRCVKMNFGLGSLSATFVGDRTYAFVGDGNIVFDYSVTAHGEDVKISTAVIDLNGDIENPVKTFTPGGTYLAGNVSVAVPDEVGNGIARYRLVSKATDGVVSRVSHALRLFDITGLKVGGNDYSEDLKCSQSEKYTVSFTLKGIETDFTVVVNGAPAVKGEVETNNGVASMPYSVSDINIPGHIHIQIIDAEGGLACEKSYAVKTDGISVEDMVFTVDPAVYITNVTEMQGGQAYLICYTGSYYNKYYCLGVGQSGKLEVLEYNVNANNFVAPTADMIFRFHRDDTKIGDMTKYNNICAGAWVNVGTDKFLKENFEFGTDAEAVYVTVANATGSNTTSNYAEFFLQNGDQLYYNGTDLAWSWMGAYYQVNKWRIYPVTISNKNS